MSGWAVELEPKYAHRSLTWEHPAETTWPVDICGTPSLHPTVSKRAHLVATRVRKGPCRPDETKDL